MAGDGSAILESRSARLSVVGKEWARMCGVHTIFHTRSEIEPVDM
jgi:hypothetical protein